ncbi:MAG: Hsp20/alpha crystallin family protein [Planctomycetota bacterium]
MQRRWDPFASKATLGEFPRTFEELFRLGFGELPLRREGEDTWLPRLNVYETASGYEVEAEVPGCGPDEVEVRVAGAQLTIRGEFRLPASPPNAHLHLHERTHGPFQRSLTFPTPIRADTVQAETREGILRVRVDKRPGDETLTIDVQEA